MTVEQTIRYKLWARQRPVAEGFRALARFAAARGRRLELTPLSVARFRLAPDRWTHCKSMSELETVLAGGDNPIAWELMLVFPRLGEMATRETLYAFIDVIPDDVLVSVKAENIDEFESLKRELEAQFGFRGLPEFAAEPRVLVPPHPTALVGCHFDERGKSQAQRLVRFLSLLRFVSVEIADAFRSQPIPEKIKAAITRNDLYFAVVTGRRDHSWLVAEMSYALAKDKRVVLLVEEGADFNPTLAGADLEYVPFRTSIDETFIAVLQEIRRLGVVGL